MNLKEIQQNDYAVTVDSILERTTEFFVSEDGMLKSSTSSTPGVTVERIYVNGKRISEVSDEMYQAVMDGLYDEGYSS